ncbi:hypothetical protein [Rhodanobacter sp. MP7CTX1]|uniref:hypothetical protein n=1 Tax=Rhodanobacter sp. MP7CTX1 TaxID=2723084 RepID=UPI00161CAA0B|nr:hypothetical protein [Rhodanobacter sp. MP7CTX1]MBB6188693.1 hypothetical protein [Rhodanobacter sp. MP7CTX1]
MNPTRATALIAMFAIALGNLLVPSARAAYADSGLASTRHFDLVNATFDSITALAIAPADGDAFHDIALGQPLQGGPTSMTFDVPAGGCLRDLRVTFHGGRMRLFSHIDVCRSSGLRLRPQIARGIGG